MNEEPGADSAEATTLLQAVQATRRRSAELRHYSHAGVHLIAWGLVWLAGNLTAQFMPARAPLAWGVGIAAAVLFQIVQGRRRTNWRVLATVAASLGFCVAAIAVAGIAPQQQTAFVSLLVAATYVGVGIWAGARFAALGLLLVAIVLVARFAFPHWEPLWLGAGGGGALILAGLWLRRA